MIQLYKMKILAFVVFFSLLAGNATAQYIQGDATVFTGNDGTYIYNDGFQHTGMQWSATNGTVFSTEENGTEYKAYVNFPTSGSATVHVQDETLDVTKNFSVNVVGCATVFSLTGGGPICGSTPVSAIVWPTETGTTYQMMNQNNVNIGPSKAGTGGQLIWTNLSPGVYIVKGTNNISGCSNLMQGMVTVIEGVIPNTYSMGGGGNYCLGAQSPAILVNGNQSNVTYELFFNGSSVTYSYFIGVGQNDGQGHTVWSNYGNKGNGTFTATATHSTGCKVSMQGPGIAEVPLPMDKSITVAGPYCSPGETGSGVRVNNPEQDVNYKLFQNGSDTGLSQTAPANGLPVTWFNQPAASYTVLATSTQTGCVRQLSSSATVTTIQGSVGGTFNPSGADVYKGDYGAVRLTDGSYIGDVQYWEKNGQHLNELSNGLNYDNIQETTHFVAYVKNGTCPEVASSEFVVTVYSKPVITGNNVLNAGSSTLLSVQSNYYTYQWYYDGLPVADATGYQLSATKTGSYTVKVKATSQAAEKASAVFVLLTPLQAQSKLNYHQVTTLRQPMQTLPLYNNVQALPLTDYSRQIEYMDGLGRTLQQVALAQTPAQKDLIVPVKYDQQGKPVAGYLPYTDGVYTGTYRASALNGTSGYTTGDQYKFYANNTTTIAHSTAPYSLSVYDNSPLDQVIEQGAPGTEWQPGNGHTVKSAVLVNSQEANAVNAIKDIRLWNLDGPTGSYYPTGKLMISQLTDENGNQTWSFTDKLGHTVLKRVQLDETLNLDGVNVATPFLETYYVYDTRGNLAMQVPPKAVAKLNNGTAWSTVFRDEWCYLYTYDVLNRLIEKKTPDAVSIYYAYDPLNRLVLTQDGNLRSQNKWLFIKYDAAGRPAMQGLYSNTTYPDRASLQLQVMDGLYGSGPHYETRGSALHGYTNQSFPQANADGSALSLLSVSYYDNYDFDYNGSDDFTYTPQQLEGEGQQATAFGMPTGSKRIVLESNTWLYAYQFYDQRGRAIQSRSSNHLSTAIDNLSTVVYDFEGKTLLTKTYHNAGGSNQTTVVNTYSYDPAGRLLAVTQKNNTDAAVTLAAYSYNELGQVIKKNLYARSDAREGQPGFELGDDISKTQYNNESELLARNSITFEPGFKVSNGKSFSAGIAATSQQGPIPEGQQYMQSVDYRYNIRGWLTSINNAQLTEDGSVNDDADGYTGDYFGMELLYTASETGMNNTAFYNGNISALKWKGVAGSGAEDQRSYKYSYDKTDRLKQATFQAHTGVAWIGESGTLNETQTYDHNGNILTLQRNRIQRTLLSATPVTMDNLTYTYASGKGNKLGRVEDSASPEGFSNLSVNADVEYDYSVDGALIRDDNKGISSITNNLLGKPQVITYTDGRAVHYTYDAAGTKLTMAVTKEGVTTTTQYVNGFVYEGNALSFFSSPEGRVVKNGNNLEYQFAISDHQGNTRVVFGTRTAGEQAVTATFETAVQEEEANDFPDSYPSGSAINPVSTNNHTTGGSKSLLLNGGYAGMVGMARSYKVYPGDKIKLEAYARYDAPTGNSSNIAGFATALLNAFSLSLPVAGELGTAATALNDWGTIAAGGFGYGTSDENHTKAFVNILVFDKSYQLLDMSFAQVTSEGAPALVSADYDVKEAGYVFLYLSNENATQTNLYFDDVRMSYTPTNIIQYNEYYPFGLQTASSWTRENNIGNNYLGNGGTEFNATSSLYDLDFRNYDPILGRMNQVDPMADSYASLSPYNFSSNDPVYWSDPSGAEPCMFCPGGSAYQGPTIERNDGGGSSGVMMNGQPMYGRDPFGNQYWAGGALGYDMYQNGASVTRDGQALVTQNGQLGYFVDDDRQFAIEGAGVGGYRPKFVSVDQEVPWYNQKNMFSDFLYEVNRYNPIANAYNAISTYITGHDSYGVEQSNTEGTIQLASAIPIPIAKISAVGSKLLSQGLKALHQHHVLSQAFKPWFKSRGISNIDDFTIAISESTHLKGVHGKGLGNLPGQWNREWADFIDANPNASPSEIFHQAEGMLRKFGLEYLPYSKYK